MMKIRQGDRFVMMGLRQLSENKLRYNLVGVTGLSSFILQDKNNIKYKITIGNKLRCSCNINQQHCIHTLFILLNIFHVQVDDSLLQIDKYSNKNLRQIIVCKRIYQLKNRNQFRRNRYKTQKSIYSYYIYQQDQDQQQKSCPICYSPILQTDHKTSCQEACRNQFHLQCFQQWINHLKKIGQPAQCPLCRDIKPRDIYQKIQAKKSLYKKAEIHQKIGKQFYYYCDGCQLREIPLRQYVYKCVSCEDVTYCYNCFKYGKHMSHSFIYKEGALGDWKDCEDRRLKKNLDKQNGLIRIKPFENNRLYNFLAATFPCYFSKKIRWTMIQCKKLGFTIDQLVCFACKNPQKIFLRRLNCGHFIHHKCLRDRIMKRLFHCKKDGQKYLLGYSSILKSEKLNKKINNLQQQCKSQIFFIKNLKQNSLIQKQNKIKPQSEKNMKLQRFLNKVRKNVYPKSINCRLQSSAEQSIQQNQSLIRQYNPENNY